MATQFLRLFWVLLFSLAATGSSYWDYPEYDYGVGYDDVDNGYYGTGVYNPSGVGHDPTTCPDCWAENGTYSGNRSINANYPEYDYGGVGHDPTTCPDCWAENGTYSGNRSINANYPEYDYGGVGHDPTTCPDCWAENGTYSGNRSINANYPEYDYGGRYRNQDNDLQNPRHTSVYGDKLGATLPEYMIGAIAGGMIYDGTKEVVKKGYRKAKKGYRQS